MPEAAHPLAFETMNNQVYVATSNGLFSGKESSLKFTPVNLVTSTGRRLDNLVVTSLGTDGSDKLYLGTASGLLIKDGEKMDWIEDISKAGRLLKRKRVFSLLFDNAENCLWVGTVAVGLYSVKFSSEGRVKAVERYSTSETGHFYIHNNSIWAFAKDKKGNLWVGTDMGLLKKSKNAPAFVSVSAEGVANKKIMGIIEDRHEKLWLSNSQGLICYDPAKELSRNYTVKDGLISSSLNEAVAQSADGKLFFGSIDGINYFNYDEIQKAPAAIGVFISDFRVHNQSVSPHQVYFDNVILDQNINEAKSVTLSYKQNNFMIEFGGSNYAVTSQHRFRYKLVGYDDEWTYTNGKQNFAAFSNLPFGRYSFYVEVANEDGVWNNDAKTIDFTITAPIWQSPAAYIVYALISFAILYFLYFSWNNRQKLKYQMEVEQMNHKKEHEVNEFKLRFFTDVAHEFKTPLSLIAGPLQDILHHNISEDQKKFNLNIVQRNTKRMLLLTNQLLDFTKINSEVNILKPSKSDVAAVIKEVAKSFHWQVKNEGIDFKIIAPEELLLCFDRDILEKALYNLLSNAFKHTPKGGVVEIEVLPPLNNNTALAIAIRDSGKGIPPADRDKIFDRFFHGDAPTASGIGLNLTATLVKAHHGSIEVKESAYGGAEFLVAIPVLEAAATPSIKQEERPATKEWIPTAYSEEKHTDPYVSKEQILVVEDDHDLRIYLKSSLEAKYKVLEAANGEEGLALALEYIPDIIISDVMMPLMDGVSMCSSIHNNNKTSHIPVLMITAKTATEHQRQGLQAGAWDYIAKPFDTGLILLKIENILATRKQMRQQIMDHHISVQIEDHYTSYDQTFIKQLTDVIVEKMSEDGYNVESLAQDMGFSRMQLHRKVKSLTGHTTSSLINTIKIKHATTMFDEGCDRVQEAMYATGILSYSHFNNLFKKINGKTASEYISMVAKKRNVT